MYEGASFQQHDGRIQAHSTPREGYVMEHDHKRGIIRHSAEAALVTSPLFRQRVVKAKVGKASYQRRSKHRNKGLESGQKQVA